MLNSFQDKHIRCRDCSNEFVFTAGEQAFYSTKGFENEPQRCTSCRTMRKKSRGGAITEPQGGNERAMHTVVCAQCGQNTEVPFIPRQGRPVYCRPCFALNQATSLS